MAMQRYRFQWRMMTQDNDDGRLEVDRPGLSALRTHSSESAGQMLQLDGELAQDAFSMT